MLSEVAMCMVTPYSPAQGLQYLNCPSVFLALVVVGMMGPAKL